MDASRPTPNYFCVSLTVQDPPPSLRFPHREIWLDCAEAKARIGRTSKVVAKGCVAAKDCGWFDSPVMSRDHAEITVDTDSKGLRITDIGSLHGTFLNGCGEAMKRNEAHPLRDGDEVRFGVPIYRGTSTFSPTTVHVGVQRFPERRTPPPKPVVFRPPPYLDEVEYQEDSDGSDVQKAIDLTKVIDLTEKVIDLTQNVPDETILVDLTAPFNPCQPQATLSSSRAPEMPVPVQTQRIFNSPRSPRYDSPSPERELEFGYELCCDDPARDSEMSIHLSDEGEDEEDIDGHDSSDEDAMWGDESEDSMATNSDDSGSDHLESDLEIRSELDETDEESSDLQVEDAQPTFHCALGDFDEYEGNDIDMEGELPQGTAYPLAQITPLGQVDLTTAQPMCIQPVALHAEHGEAPQKPNVINISSLLNPAPRPVPPFRTTTGTDPKPTTAAVLGPKTGKHEFFAAREQNKLNFTGAGHPGSKTAPTPTPQSQRVPPTRTTYVEGPATERVPEAEPVGKSDYVQELAKSPLLDSGEKFLNSPLPLVVVPRPLTTPVISVAEDDLVSAADFHQKKLAEYQKQLTIREVFSATMGVKRKAEDISSSDDGDVDPAAQAAVPSTSEHQIPLEAAEPNSAPAAPVAPTTERGHLAVSEADRVLDGEPPAKRNATEAAKEDVGREVGKRTAAKGRGKAWQLAEKAGLVALGGAVVLGSLIYSAPTF